MWRESKRNDVSVRVTRRGGHIVEGVHEEDEGGGGREGGGR